MARTPIRTIAGGVALASAAMLGLSSEAAAANCAPTYSEPANSSYVAGAPVRTTIGKGHVLTGIIRSSNGCRPLYGARIELFQAGPNGQYSQPSNGSWPYRATVLSRLDGSYRFEGPFPTDYGGVTPHVHLRVTAPGHAVMNTTYFPPRGEKRGRLVLVLATRAR